ncbi:alpha/beta hydrolase [Amycolatopsis sp. NPDC059657]|uniref:alpha/beta hydrolase n=1 Tax=Amycolatopsis sp. NPDC059657 TaxID=3346899 RepID=UPI00366FE089
MSVPFPEVNDGPAAEETQARIVHVDGVSTGARVLALALRTFIRPVLVAGVRYPSFSWPWGLVDYAGLLLPARKGTDLRPVRLPNCRAEWVEALGASQDRVVLYLHGGGFVCCGLRTHRRLVSRISAAADGPVLNVDYRMLPRNPISSAVSDGVDGYKWLLSNGFRPEQIVVAGDSAGGYLAFMVALAVAELDLPRPAGVAALSPLTEIDPARKIAHPNASTDAYLVPQSLKLIVELNERIVVEGQLGPHVCPVDSELAEMPPTLIQVGSTEMLLADAELMAERLAAAGSECEVQVWEKQVHVFQAGADILPEARRAIRRIGEFVKRVAP